MNKAKNNEPQELKCPFCGKTPVYGVFVTSYYFRKEHKLYNSSENLIIPESQNDNISDVIGYPIEEIPNPSIRIQVSAAALATRSGYQASTKSYLSQTAHALL